MGSLVLKWDLTLMEAQVEVHFHFVNTQGVVFNSRPPLGIFTQSTKQPLPTIEGTLTELGGGGQRRDRGIHLLGRVFLFVRKSSPLAWLCGVVPAVALHGGGGTPSLFPSGWPMCLSWSAA